MAKDEPYYYVRFCWWIPNNLEKLSEELATRFNLVKLPIPKEDERELSLYKSQRGLIEVKADTLSAFLSPFTVVLSQKEKAPFTEKDMELRKTILALYPQIRPTPFPWHFSKEPKFEIKH
jgi:hypothetical protein